MKPAALLAGACLLWVAGCASSPDFVHPPPASYRMLPPAAIDGVWAREGPDNGERVRVTRLEGGAVKFDFIHSADRETPLPGPLLGETVRFGELDWLVVDRRVLGAAFGDRYSGKAPYTLVQFALESDDRICAIAPSARPFAEAVRAGRLAGTVDDSFKPWVRVVVSAAGEDVVRWWSTLPAADKVFAPPAACFMRTGR